MKPILVLYATREGQTRRIAEYLAAAAQARGLYAMPRTPPKSRTASPLTIIPRRSSAHPFIAGATKRRCSIS
jgi:flavodoxin